MTNAKGGEFLLKILKKFGFIAILIFIILFLYFYKASKKFRESILAAFIALTVGVNSGFLNAQPASAKEADAAFTQRHNPHNNRPQKPGFFNSKSKNNGSEPGKGGDPDGDDDGIPDLICPKPESVEQTERRVFNIDKHIKKLEEITDSDSETETENDKSDDKQKKKINPKINQQKKINLTINKKKNLTLILIMS